MEELRPEYLPEEAPKPEGGFMGQSLPELSAQEERFVMLHCSGMSPAAAARSAGYAHGASSGQLMKRPAIRAAIDRFRQELREQVRFDITTAHAMYMEAYANAASSTEQRQVVDSLVKLHGLIQPAQPTVTINHITVNKAHQMTDEQLLKLLGKDAEYLDPEAHIIEAEYEEAGDD